MTRAFCRTLLLIVGGTSCAQSAQDEFALRPGQDIQAIVERAPEGAHFRFEPGLYRMQAILPRDRQRFTGQAGVVLSGAMELTDWTQEAGLWRSELLPEPLRSDNGRCKEDRPLCTVREDLFVNGRVYQRVGSRDELRPGTWYYEDRRAFLADDPTGQSVELGVTPFAFGGDAEGVVLEQLIIEKYASLAQKGAIQLDDAQGWQLSDVTVRWNHGTGLRFGPGTQVKGGSFSHNGQLGMGGEGDGVMIEGAEIAFNNYAGYDPSWEAGGSKFAQTRGLVVRDTCVHHNGGPGLWTDIDNIDVLYDGNKVFLNADDGIKHEISYDAVIRNNISSHNGTSKFDEWLWGSQILVQNSSNVEIYDNLVEVSDAFGNGIGIIYQERGEGAYGSWRAVENRVHDNTIVHLGARGQNGAVTDTGDASFWHEADNSFDRNTYVVADRDGDYWSSNGREEDWHGRAELGFEEQGELIVEQRAPTELSCAR